VKYWQGAQGQKHHLKAYETKQQPHGDIPRTSNDKPSLPSNCESILHLLMEEIRLNKGYREDQPKVTYQLSDLVFFELIRRLSLKNIHQRGGQIIVADMANGRNSGHIRAYKYINIYIYTYICDLMILQ